MSSEKASVVVIGGGLFGCSIAYYYTCNNPGKKIIVLERNALCNAATTSPTVAAWLCHRTDITLASASVSAGERFLAMTYDLLII